MPSTSSSGRPLRANALVALLPIAHVACAPGDPLTIEVAPSVGRVELTFQGVCYCFDSAEQATAWVETVGQMALTGQFDPALAFGGAPEQRVAEPAPGKPGRTWHVFPGSGGVKQRIEQREPRLGGEAIADVLRTAGAQIRDSWCGPCFGQGPDALVEGQKAITTFNRNWQNRMGVGGEGYLASPVVVAASALLGYMAPPDALGLDWSAERFGV